MHPALPLPLARLSRHAQVRANARRIPADAVEIVLSWGREVHTRGAWIYVAGRREVRIAAAHGVDLLKHEGIHVVCADDGTVITVYRNHDLSGLRPRRRRAA